jgi:hypothetical protein
MNIQSDGTPWYRPPVMWLVVALPLLSLVGGLAMVVLSELKPDIEIHSERLQQPAGKPAG